MTEKSFLSVIIALCAAAAVSAQNVKIAFRFNTASDDGKNFVNWSAGDTRIKDTYDALSGASAAHSTAALSAVRYAGGTKKAVPKGLYALLLYAVSPHSAAEKDAFAVCEEDGTFMIQFIHRSTAYRITAGGKGYIDILSGFQIAEDVCEKKDGVFVLKKDYVKDGGDPLKMTDCDWTKLSFTEDIPDPEADAWYTGALRTSLKENILSVNGKLKKTVPEKKPEEKAAPETVPGAEEKFPAEAKNSPAVSD